MTRATDSRTARESGTATLESAGETAIAALTEASGGVRRALSAPTASDVAMIGCTLAIGIGVGSTLVGPGLAALAIVAGLAAALTTALLASRRPIVRAIGGALAVPVAVLVASPSTLAWALVATGSGLGVFAGASVWALVIAGLAAGLVSWERLGDGGVRRGATGTMLACVGVIGVAGLRILPESTARQQAAATVAEVTDIVWSVLVAADGSWATLWLAVVLALVAVAVSRTLSYLPLERFVPSDRRDALSTGVARVRRGCSLVLRLAAAIALASFVVPSVSDRIEEVPLRPAAIAAEVPPPLGDALATLVTASEVRLALVAIGGVALGLALIEWTRRALGRGIAVVLARLIAPVVGGAAVATALGGLLADSVVAARETALNGAVPPTIADLLASIPPFAIVAVVLVLALGTLSSLLGTVTTLRAVRLLPARAIGAALAAGSVFVLSAGLAIVGRVEPAILTAAGAFVLWDVGEYADGIRTELGRDAATVRAELVHVGGSLLTGAAVAGGTIACYRWVALDVSATDPARAAVAVGAGLVALVVVSWSLRA